mmetsp:Transcript_8889/g.19540  ORF Transcript_8889/g.19540 Transcript_8889/m.19540 type:complete len:261 (-) Transcript_8889:301-1083(-)
MPSCRLELSGSIPQKGAAVEDLGEPGSESAKRCSAYRTASLASLRSFAMPRRSSERADATSGFSRWRLAWNSSCSLSRSLGLALRITATCACWWPMAFLTGPGIGLLCPDSSVSGKLLAGLTEPLSSSAASQTSGSPTDGRLLPKGFLSTCGLRQTASIRRGVQGPGLDAWPLVSNPWALLKLMAFCSSRMSRHLAACSCLSAAIISPVISFRINSMRSPAASTFDSTLSRKQRLSRTKCEISYSMVSKRLEKAPISCST